MKHIHIITPFSRYHLLEKLLNAYRPLDVIWHPLTFKDRIPVLATEPWVQPFIANADHPVPAGYQTVSLNMFIDQSSIVDDDYYVTAADDDMYEPEVFKALQEMDDPVVIISMKRGQQIPEGTPVLRAYDTNTLIASPENMEVGFIGGEQIFMKGSVLKSIRFNEETAQIADGLLAIQLVKDYKIRYAPNLYALFNYYEPCRWDKKEDKIIFGCLVNDELRLAMVLKQSELPTDIVCHTITLPESATKGLNTLLNMIEHDGGDIAVLTHQDMYYREDWLPKLRDKLARLPESWIVAGVVGKDMEGAICGRFHDKRIPMHIFSEHTFPVEASCFDECCIIVNMKKKFRFDETLTGFDLYGSLCVLQAREMGGTAWIVDIFSEHYCMRPFTWFPDEAFQKSFKWLHDRFPGMEIDSTVLGVPKKELEAVNN